MALSGEFAEHLSSLLFSEVEGLFGSEAAKSFKDAIKIEDASDKVDTVVLRHKKLPDVIEELEIASFLESFDLTGDSLLDFLVSRLVKTTSTWRVANKNNTLLPTVGLDDLLKTALKSVPNPQLSSLLRLMESEQFVVLEGQSSSGKTTLLSQLVQNLSYEEKNPIWIDFSEIGYNVLSAIRQIDSDKANIIIVDNAQASPIDLSVLAQTFELLVEPMGIEVKVIVATWPSGTELAKSLFDGAVVLVTDPSSMINTITKSLSSDAQPESIEKVARLAGGDCLVASILAENLGAKDMSEALQKSVLKNVFLHARPTKQDKAVAYILTALGQFEIPVTLGFLSLVLGKPVDDVGERLRLRQVQNRVSLGHRTFCYLAMASLLKEMPNLSKTYGSSSDIALRYIRALGDRDLLGVLSRLDLSSRDVGSQTGSDVDQGMLVQLWEAFNLLKARLIRLAELDPTFKDNIASAVFASTVLAHVAEPTWEKVAEYVRGRWKPRASQGLVTDSGKPSAERNDFDAIITAMNEGDPYSESFGFWEAPDDIDKDKFHRSWLVSLLLLFEGTAIGRDNKRVRKLKDFAESNITPSGAFYPQRVTWVTASNLRGYASLGLKIGSEQVLEEAFLWLKQSAPTGPLLDDSYWAHGTGHWNTEYQTTAMCLAALVEIGVPTTDPTIANARDFLLEKRSDWIASEKSAITSAIQIGRVDVINSLIKVGVDWSIFKVELEEAIAWSNNPNTWSSGGSVVATETKEESSNLTYVSSLLLQLIWAVMKENVVSLLIESNRRFVTSGLAGIISPDVGKRELREAMEAGQANISAWFHQIARRLDEDIDSRLKTLARLPQRKGISDLPALESKLDELRARRERLDKIYEAIQQPRLAFDDFQALEAEFSEIAVSVLGSSWKTASKTR